MIIDDFSNPKRKLTVSEASAANDYFTRRKSEEDRIAGVKAPAKNKKNPANTDYAKRRKQQDVTKARQDASNYKVMFVDPDGISQDLGKASSPAEANELIKTKFYDIFDTGDRLRKVASHIFALETDYTNTGKRVNSDNYKDFYHWIVQSEQGVAEDATSDLLNMRRDDPRIKQNQDINAVAKEIYAQMVAERGQPMDSRQQNTWMTIAQTKAAAKLSNPAAQNESQGMAEAGRRPNHGREERHDLDPSDWYKVKDGKMFRVSIYPRQVAQAEREGYSRTQAEAKAAADSQGVAEGLNEFVPDGFNGGDDETPGSWDDFIKAFDPEIRKMGFGMDKRSSHDARIYAHPKEEKGVMVRQHPEQDNVYFKLFHFFNKGEDKVGLADLSQNGAASVLVKIENFLNGQQGVAEGLGDHRALGKHHEEMTDRELRKVGNKLPDSWDAAVFRRK